VSDEERCEERSAQRARLMMNDSEGLEKEFRRKIYSDSRAMYVPFDRATNQRRLIPRATPTGVAGSSTCLPARAFYSHPAKCKNKTMKV